MKIKSFLIFLNMQRRLLLFLFLFCSCSMESFLMKGLKHVNHPIQKTQYYKQLNDYQQDFVFLTALLEEAYPYLYQSWPQDDYNRKKQQLIAQFANIKDKEEFKLAIQKFVATLENSHTRVNAWFPDEISQFPYELRSVGDTLIIWKVDESLDSSLIGSSVFRFNGYPIQEVREEVNQYIPIENKFRSKIAGAWSLSYPNFLKRLRIIDTPHVTLSCRTREGTIKENIVTPVESSKLKWHRLKRYSVTAERDSAFYYQIMPEYNLAYFQFNVLMDKAAMFDGINEYCRPIFRPFARWFLEWQFKKVRKGKKAIYVRPGQESLPAFLSEMFQNMDKSGINNLVVDLRYNSGGDFTLSKQLLYWLDIKKEIQDVKFRFKITNFFQQHFERIYEEMNNAYKKVQGVPLPQSAMIDKDSLLVVAGEKSEDFYAEIKDKNSPYYMQEPSKRFSGNIYVLIGPGTGSAASALATLMKDNGIGTFVGTPTYNRPTGATGSSKFLLPNTHIELSIAAMYQVRPDTSLHHEDGLYPHILIRESVVDILKGKDPAFEWIINHINKGNR